MTLALYCDENLAFIVSCLPAALSILLESLPSLGLDDIMPYSGLTASLCHLTFLLTSISTVEDFCLTSRLKDHGELSKSFPIWSYSCILLSSGNSLHAPTLPNTVVILSCILLFPLYVPPLGILCDLPLEYIQNLTTSTSNSHAVCHYLTCIVLITYIST